jgi:SAM-dependent methyltransferase
MSEAHDYTERRRTSFDANAQLYGKMRPSYPRELVDDMAALTGIPAGGSILEIGCGAGQATLPFASRGYRMLSLDIGTDLIAVAREKLGGAGNVEFLVSSFEDWDPNGRRFDVVMAASCFHWMTLGVRYTKSAEVLEPHGALVLLSHSHVRKNEGFFAEVQEVYRTHAPKLGSPGRRAGNRWHTEGEAGYDLFETPVERSYPWSAEYDSEGYVKLLHTYSNHACLDEAKREKLYAGIRALIDERYGGRVVRHVETVLHVRRKKG